MKRILREVHQINYVVRLITQHSGPSLIDNPRKVIANLTKTAKAPVSISIEHEGYVIVRLA